MTNEELHNELKAIRKVVSTSVARLSHYIDLLNQGQKNMNLPAKYTEERVEQMIDRELKVLQPVVASAAEAVVVEQGEVQSQEPKKKNPFKKKEKQTPPAETK